MDERIMAKLKKLEEKAVEFPKWGCTLRAKELLNFIHQNEGDNGARIAYVKPKWWKMHIYFKRFEVKWTYHCVVAWNGEILDPSLGFPVPSDDYLTTFYGRASRSPSPVFSEKF